MIGGCELELGSKEDRVGMKTADEVWQVTLGSVERTIPITLKTIEYAIDEASKNGQTHVNYRGDSILKSELLCNKVMNTLSENGYKVTKKYKHHHLHDDLDCLVISW